MSGIVCAIRGGPTSEPTIASAMELAKRTDLTLHFLYVVNLHFLSYTESSRVKVIMEELEEMGEFIVLAAKEKAEARGVRAEAAVRNGKVGEEIIGFSQEIEADYVVLGSPQGQDERDVFTHERLRSFIERVEQESGAKVVLATATEA